MDDNARYMLTIAETGSISESARRMHISQPALSQRLKHLEERFGIPLFDRSTTPLAPTQAGSLYLEWARKAIDAEDSTIREISAIANKSTRRLRIGTSLPRSNGLLPDIIEKFYRKTTGCTLFFHEAGMPESHDRLLSGTGIDFAIFTPVRPEASMFSGEPICEERILLIAPSDWNIPSQDEDDGYPIVDPKIIAGMPFIMPPGHLKHNRIIRGMMDTADVKINIALHSCSNEMTLEMIKRGIGVSIAPSTFVLSHDNARISLYAIRGYTTRNSLYYNRPLNKKVSNDEKTFIQIAREWISQRPTLLPR
jgi:DNA-binding transcriptional LysR family regulator